MPSSGIEPETRGFSVLCSTNWANWAQMLSHWVAGIGFEPMTFGLWARRASRLLHPAIWNYILSFRLKPMIGLEPITCWLQISCSANWATSARECARLKTYCKFVNHFYIHQWMEVDSNHRSNLQQIYSLSPLATRESIHIKWDLQGSNLWPSACKADALPAELRFHDDPDRTRTDDLRRDRATL